MFLMCRCDVYSSHMILKWLKTAFHCWKDLMKGCFVGLLSTSCMVCVIFILMFVVNSSSNNRPTRMLIMG